MKPVRWILPIVVAVLGFFPAGDTAGVPGYSLTITVTGNGAVDKNPHYQYYYLDDVNLTATPGKGWRFVRWEGDVTGPNNPDSITMDDDKNVTAVFSRLPNAGNNLLLLDE